jgi:predicted ATPase
MKGARIYDFDENPVKTKNWTDVANVKMLYDFFKSHEKEFDKGV